MIHTDYAPLITNLFQTVLDAEKAAPTPSHKADRKRRVHTLHTEIVQEKAAVQKKLDKATAWFNKHGGFGSEEPNPLPPKWNERTEQWQKWLWDYQVLQCCNHLTTVLLLEGE